MNIDELLNKYFEGETTCEEERQIRHFFIREQVPERLEVYRSMFAFLETQNKQFRSENEERSAKSKTVPATKKTKKKIRHYIRYTLSGIAAGLILLFGITGIHHQMTATPDNYVIINGKKYTDINMIKEQAQSAFNDVCISPEEIFETMFEE